MPSIITDDQIQNKFHKYESIFKHYGIDKSLLYTYRENQSNIDMNDDLREENIFDRNENNKKKTITAKSTPQKSKRMTAKNSPTKHKHSKQPVKKSPTKHKHSKHPEKKVCSKFHSKKICYSITDKTSR